MVLTLWKVGLQFFKKLNIETPYDPKELKTGTQTNTSTLIVILPLFIIAKR